MSVRERCKGKGDPFIKFGRGCLRGSTFNGRRDVMAARNAMKRGGELKRRERREREMHWGGKEEFRDVCKGESIDEGKNIMK